MIRLLTFLLPLSTAAANSGPASFTLDGRLYQASTFMLLNETVQFRIQILNGDKTCILYEEIQDRPVAQGFFNLRVGGDPGDPKRGPADSNNSMPLIFQNEHGIPATGCPSPHQPQPGEARFARLIVTPQSTGEARVMTPDLLIDAVPNALVAETLRGFAPDDFLRAGTVPELTQAAVEDLVKGDSLLYLRNDVNGTSLPNRSSDPPTASLSPGQLWFDSSGVIKYYNGSSIQSLGVSGAGLTSLGTSGGIVGGPITSTGTISLETLHGSAGSGAKVNYDVYGRVTSAGALVAADIPALNYTTLKNSLSLSPWPATSCGAGAFVTWQSTSDSFVCLTLSSGQVGSALGYTPVNKAGDTMTGTLEVTNTVANSGNPTIRISGAANTNFTGTNGYIGSFEFHNNFASNAGVAAAIVAGRGQNTAGSGELHFMTSPSAAAPVDRLTIDRLGNVGIGTSLPLTNLQILTASNVDTLTRITTTSGINKSGFELQNNWISSGLSAGWYLYPQNYVGTNAFGEAVSAHESNLVAGQATTVALKVGTKNASNLAFYTNSLPRMVIGANGQIGVGTASPSVLLDVGGGTGGAGNVARFAGSVAIGKAGSEVGQLTLYSTSGRSMSLSMNNTSDATISSTFGNINLTPATNTVFTAGNVGIGTGTPLAKLQVQGSYQSSQSGAVYVARDLAQWDSNSSSTTGTLVITMPQSWSSTMMRLSIRGYSYWLGAWEVTIGGYNYSSSNWIATSAQITGNAPFSQVRLGHDGKNNVILLGDLTTSVAYLQVNVAEGTFSRNNRNLWATGWSISQVTDESPYTSVINVPVTSWQTSGNNAYYAAGKVGIGTASPATNLESQAAGTASSTFRLSSAGNSAYYTDFINNVNASNAFEIQHHGFTLLKSSADGYGGITLGNRGYTFETSTTGTNVRMLTNGIERFRIDNGGNIGIGTSTPAYKLDVVGDVNASGCARAGGSVLGGTCSSDERLKTDVRPFSIGLDALLGITPRLFRYNGLGEHPVSSSTELGVIAQEVERTAPALVISKEVRLHPEDLHKTEIKQVNYTAFTYVLINAVKDLYRRWSSDSQALRRELELLKKEIGDRDQRIHELISTSDHLKRENAEIRTYLCGKDPRASICGR